MRGERRAGHRADDEKQQHAQVHPQLGPVRGIVRAVVAQLLGQPDADLADVIGGEGGRYRDALRLPEGVVLHGGDEVDRDLRDLHGRAVRHKAQKRDHGHLDQDEQRVPADGQTVLDRVGEQLGDERAHHIGGDRDEVIQPLQPFARAERHAHQHDVAGLRVAEHIAPQQIGERAPKARHEDQDKVDPVALADQIITVASLFFLHTDCTIPLCIRFPPAPSVPARAFFLL